MTTFFCPSCWGVVGEDRPRCPVCGCDIAAYLGRKSYTQRLIEALDHPEPETPVRAACILGLRGDRDAVAPLAATAAKTSDVYLAMACLEALAKIGGTEAREGIRGFCGDRRTLMARRAQDLAEALAEVPTCGHRRTGLGPGRESLPSGCRDSVESGGGPAGKVRER